LQVQDRRNFFAKEKKQINGRKVTHRSKGCMEQSFLKSIALS